jgi:hypothetical protein
VLLPRRPSARPLEQRQCEIDSTELDGQPDAVEPVVLAVRVGGLTSGFLGQLLQEVHGLALVTASQGDLSGDPERRPEHLGVLGLPGSGKHHRRHLLGFLHFPL